MSFSALIAEREYKGRREAIEDAFRSKLIDGEVLGSAIRRYFTKREVIDPSLWEVLTIEYGFADDAVGLWYHYQQLEFFEPTEVPKNVPLLVFCLHPSKMRDNSKRRNDG